MNLLWRSQRRFLLRQPLLTALTVLGIALGVAVIHATDIANRSASASLADAHRQLHGFAQYRVLGSGRPLAETDYATLRRHWLDIHPDWRLQPVVEGSVQIGATPWQLLGIDAVADPRLSGGATPEAGAAIGLIGAPAALLSAGSATALGLATGAALTVDTATGPRTLTVLGTFDDPRGLLARLLIVDIGTAQQLLQLPGQLSYLELVSTSTPDRATLEQLRATLPPGLQLLGDDTLLAGNGALLDAFQFNLAALSVLALLVGCLLMFSVAQFSFWQRRASLERLHLLGVGRQRLLAGLLAEALLLAAGACAIGWLLGEWLSRALLPLAAVTVNDLFAAQPVVRFGGAPRDYLKTAALAGVALAGTQWLLFRRWRRELEPAAQERRDNRHQSLASLALAALGAAALLAPGATLSAGFIAVFAFSGAWLLAAPALYRAALGRLERLHWGPLAAIALRDSRRHYRRLALALAALCLALAAGLGIRVMVDSFRHSLLGWLDQQVAADIYVSAAPARMAALATQMAQRPEVEALGRSRHIELNTSRGAVDLHAIDLPARGRDNYPLLASAGPVWELLHGDAVIVGEPLARRWRLTAGDSIVLPTPQGERRFLVAGIGRDYSTDSGRVALSLDTYRRHWHDQQVDSLGLYLRSGIDATPLQRELATAGHRAVAGAAIKTEVARLFDRTFAITYLLQLLVSVVALAALISTLLIHQLMQRRQLATLRALGLRRRGLLQLLLTQALALGIAAGILALPLGYALAWLLVNEINPRAFGWSLTFYPSATGAVQILLFAPLLALLAALYPAWRSLRMTLARELSRE